MSYRENDARGDLTRFCGRENRAPVFGHELQFLHFLRIGGGCNRETELPSMVFPPPFPVKPPRFRVGKESQIAKGEPAALSDSLDCNVKGRGAFGRCGILKAQS